MGPSWKPSPVHLKALGREAHVVGTAALPTGLPMVGLCHGSSAAHALATRKDQPIRCSWWSVRGWSAGAEAIVIDDG